MTIHEETVNKLSIQQNYLQKIKWGNARDTLLVGGGKEIKTVYRVCSQLCLKNKVKATKTTKNVKNTSLPYYFLFSEVFYKVFLLKL